MNIAISNLAWDETIPNNYTELGIRLVEIAPTKIASWADLGPETVVAYRQSLAQRGLTPYSMQSLFYGATPNADSDICKHFQQVINIAKLLDVKILVFGSPGLRNEKFSWQSIFPAVDTLLDNTGITLCIEPNARIYNGKFFFTIDEIVDYLRNSGLTNDKTMIDTHNLIHEKQNPAEKFLQHKEYICHIHASEIKLAPITEWQCHEDLSAALKSEQYAGVVNYEVNTSPDLYESLKKFSKVYS